MDIYRQIHKPYTHTYIYIRMNHALAALVELEEVQPRDPVREHAVELVVSADADHGGDDGAGGGAREHAREDALVEERLHEADVVEPQACLFLVFRSVGWIDGWMVGWSSGCGVVWEA